MQNLSFMTGASTRVNVQQLNPEITQFCYKAGLLNFAPPDKWVSNSYVSFSPAVHECILQQAKTGKANLE